MTKTVSCPHGKHKQQVEVPEGRAVAQTLHGRNLTFISTICTICGKEFLYNDDPHNTGTLKPSPS